MTLKIGDKVRIIDGSYAVRVDKYEISTHIGICGDVFEVINIINPHFIKTNLGCPVHDIFILNTETGRIYLHSSRFVRITSEKYIKSLEEMIDALINKGYKPEGIMWINGVDMEIFNESLEDCGKLRKDSIWRWPEFLLEER